MTENLWWNNRKFHRLTWEVIIYYLKQASMSLIFGLWVSGDITFDLTFSAQKISSENEKEMLNTCVPVSDVIVNRMNLFRYQISTSTKSLLIPADRWKIRHGFRTITVKTKTVYYNSNMQDSVSIQNPALCLRPERQSTLCCVYTLLCTVRSIEHSVWCGISLPAVTISLLQWGLLTECSCGFVTHWRGHYYTPQLLQNKLS